MKRSEKVVRILTSALATLVAILFVYGYSGIKYHNAVEHGQMAIPPMLEFIHATGYWALAVPICVILAGVAFSRRELPIIIIVNISWLSALAWPLLCIFAWEVPFIIL